jgi:hypothetical protein
MTIIQRLASLLAATVTVGVIMFPVAAQAAQMLA